MRYQVVNFRNVVPIESVWVGVEVPNIGCEEEGDATVEVIGLFGARFGYKCHRLAVAVGRFSYHREERISVGAGIVAFVVLCCFLSGVVDAEAPVGATDRSVWVEDDISLSMGEPW